MANWAYLNRCDSDQIYPMFEDNRYDRAKHTLIAAAGGLPLMWWFLLAPEDLKTKVFTVEVPERALTLDEQLDEKKVRMKKEEFEETAPLALATTALARLHDRKEMMNEWYRANGGLDHHFNFFTTHLSAHEGKYLSIDWEEVKAIHRGFMVDAKKILQLIVAKDAAAKPMLARLSTIMEDRKFLPRQKLKDYNEDWWNYARIMGESYILKTPWN